MSANYFITNHLQELKQFFKSTSFSKAILIGIAVTLPVLIGLQTDHFEIGLAICFGAFWSSPSDVSGSFRHKMVGISFSAALITVVSFIGGYLHLTSWLLLPIFGILTFFIAFISVYGFRASLISFSGLFALVLSFAHTAKSLEVYEYALLIGAGGLWYLLLATLWYRINPKAQTEELFTETFDLTSEFLETRGKLVGEQPDRVTLQDKLLELQRDLVAKHQTLREILILSRKSSGRSSYQGKRLLVFVQLVDILETAVANPVNYDKMDALFKDHPIYIKAFQELIFELSRELAIVGKWSNNPRKFPANDKLNTAFEQVGQQIGKFKKESQTQDYERYLMLQNLLSYQEKLFDKLKKIKWLLGNPDNERIDFLDVATLKRFVARQDYDPRLWLRNLSFRSTIFRHSLRLAVTMIVGYLIGNYLEFQNPYWILLTIMVIMRPSYGLTKTRTKDRIIGTLLGAAIATGVVFLVQHPYAYAGMGIVSLIIGFSMVQKNYKAAATFITLSVVFLYAIIRPDILTVIQYRVFDTLIGAAISFMATIWLWPAWESFEIRKTVEDSVRANKGFFDSIINYYQQKGNIPTTYKLSRKEAFLETSNLSSAFQRMAQEPKSKQENIDKVYELVVLNHTFLSSLSSLSSYIQHHPTSAASEKFNAVTATIDKNLVQILDLLEHGNGEGQEIHSEKPSALNEQFPVFTNENGSAIIFENSEPNDRHQEAHLIWEQLAWLFSLSAKMLLLTSKLKVE